MRRFSNLAVILCAISLVFVFSVEVSAQDQCNLAKDLVVQALERVKTGTNDEVGDGLQLLKHATEVCISSGDAWYYRSLFANKLGQTANAKYAMDKAKTFGSQAMDQGADPFHLATGGGGTLVKAPVGPVHEKWALVIGISKFQDKHLKGLEFSSKDAQDFSNLLLDPNVGRFKASNVQTLTGEVTTRQVKEDLNWLARSAGEDDLVVIFLSSHGTPRNFDTAEVNYIATSDTQVVPEDDLFATAMPMVELSDIVRTRIKARRTVIFLDTCHSGAATASLPERATVGSVDSSASMDVLDRIRQGVGRVILTSSKPDEVSSEGTPFQNGYFTHFLLLALKQNNGMATIDQVFAYMNEQLPKAAQAVRKKQTPVISRSDLGSDIVLGSPAASATGAGVLPQTAPDNLYARLSAFFNVRGMWLGQPGHS